MHLRKSDNKCANNNIRTENKSLVNLERITWTTKSKIKTIKQTVTIIEIKLGKIEKGEIAST